MSFGKPAPKPTQAQRDEFGRQLKRDVKPLAKSMFAAALQHLDEHPESSIAQGLNKIEHETGLFTIASRVAARYFEEEAAKAAASEQKVQDPKIVDAEIVDEEPTKR